MGSDKGLLVYNGKPQREYLFEILSACCSQVFTSCRKDQHLPDALNPLPDRVGIPGPMNGILTAFAHAPRSAWLIVAVDMPFIRLDVLQLLIASRDSRKLATCFYNPETEQPEPLLTLWEAGAYPALREFSEKGKVSPRDFLKTHPVKMLPPPDAKTLLNYNHPQL